MVLNDTGLLGDVRLRIFRPEQMNEPDQGG